MEQEGLDDRTVHAIAEEIGDSRGLVKLAMSLDFSFEKADMFRKTNRTDGVISAKGTTQMLFEWKQKTHIKDQQRKLKDALEKAEFVEIADKFFGNLEPVGAVRSRHLLISTSLMFVTGLAVVYVVSLIFRQSLKNNVSYHQSQKRQSPTEGSSDFVQPLGHERIVSRQRWQGWRGREPKSREAMNTPVSYVIVLHTTGILCETFDECCKQMRLIQNFHMDERGWDDIGYSFVVGNDGRVYEGRGWNRVGAHTIGYNDKSIGVAVAGSFNTDLPSKEALDALKYIINLAVKEKVLTEDYILLGQRQASPGRSGPGDALYRELQSWPHWKEGNFFLS